MGNGSRHEFCCDGAYEGWGCTCSTIKSKIGKRNYSYSFIKEKDVKQEQTEEELRREMSQAEGELMQDEFDEFEGYSDYEEEY